jgi:general secretion pathway protein G
LTKASHQARGFHLVEIIITVAIVSILGMMAAPSLQLAAQRQKEQDLRVALRQIRTAIDAYHQAAVEKRIEVSTDNTGYPANLEVLVKGVADISKPDNQMIYFIRRLPRDPMHPDKTLSAAETWGVRSYASPADAPEEGEDVFDVYSLSEATGLNNVPYRDW